MSSEKLEALMWTAGAYVEPDGFQAVIGPNGELYGRAWATTKTMARGFVESHNRQIRAAHALGVEEGKREAQEALHWKGVHCIRVENELVVANRENKRLREAAPVDDGRRFEIWLSKFGLRSTAFRGEYTTAQKDTLLEMNVGSSQVDVYEARAVEQKHVHVWSDAFSDGTRICATDGCRARQVAEWKDEP